MRLVSQIIHIQRNEVLVIHRVSRLERTTPTEAWIPSTELPPGNQIALVPLSLLLEATSTVSEELTVQRFFLNWAEISLPMSSTSWSQLYVLGPHRTCLLLCSVKAFQRYEDTDPAHFSLLFSRLIINPSEIKGIQIQAQPQAQTDILA